MHASTPKHMATKGLERFIHGFKPWWDVQWDAKMGYHPKCWDGTVLPFFQHPDRYVLGHPPSQVSWWGSNVGVSHSIENPRWPHPMGFETLVAYENNATHASFHGWEPSSQPTQPPTFPFSKFAGGWPCNHATLIQCWHGAWHAIWHKQPQACV